MSPLLVSNSNFIVNSYLLRNDLVFLYVHDALFVVCSAVDIHYFTYL